MTNGLAPAVTVEHRADGELRLSCPIRPLDVGSNMVDILVDRAEQHPDRPLICELDDAGVWQELTYADAVDQSRRVAQWLLDQDASADRPLIILSPRSRQHFVIGWGAQMAGVPYCPVSVAYSTVPGAFPKLDWVIDQLRPGFVYAQDLAVHHAGLASARVDPSRAAVLDQATFITDDSSPGTVSVAEVLETTSTAAVDDAISAIDADTITRYLFTSGSTGMPKGVIQTHGMHVAFLGAMKAIDAEPPDGDVRVLDWMPWSHTASGVMRLNLMIHDAGTVYLDTGRPVPGAFDATVRNLAAVRPTVYSGSPLGWSMLVDALEADPDLASTFFADVTSFGFGAAAMPATTAARLQRLAHDNLGRPILLTTSLLSTEVSVGLNRWWQTEDHAVLGLPGPGADIKLVPLDGDRYEIRPRGPGVTPGYLDPDVTADAFDDDGFFRMGDAVRFIDPDDPARGLCFAGRVAEDFKLSSGTWVEAGTLRSAVVSAASPFVRDAVICGLNEHEVTALVWPNMETCAALAGEDHPAQSAAVRDAIASGLARFNAANPASSTKVARFMLLEAEPEQSAHEITEKGYINQRAVQQHRAEAVRALYDGDPNVTAVPTSG